VVLEAGVTSLTSCARGRGAPVSRHKVWAGKRQPLPSARSRRRARIWEGQGPRRERAQRAQPKASTRARPEQVGGGQQDFNKIRETVTGQTGTSFTVFGYDNDQLLTCASWTSCSGSSAANALRLTRDPQRGGLITQIALGNTTETLGYNTFGELARQTSSYSASPIADITYDAAGVERDKLGRIVQKTEVVLGVTKVYQYTYDALRRLTDVTVNGVLEEHFEYDANGNRTAGYKAGVGTWTGTYDDQDRLLTYGPWVFTYTANGELETKTNTETDEEWLFQYDALGNLLSVGLPNGDLVEYLVDGMGRRIGKMKNGVLLKQWVYRDALKPVAELDGSGALVAQFAYGSKGNVPDYVRRGAATYRVISDHLGSPRHVVNVADPNDVPFQASYSSFGEVAGAGLDWMPFGFAGGIYDGDSGLVRFGARDYESMIGRWVSKDPMRFDAGDGPNIYVYAGNDPINFIDENGRFIAPLLCAYYMWRYSETLEECRCQVRDACAGDNFFTDECQSGSGGFYGTAVFNCIRNKDPGAAVGLGQHCTAFSVGGAIGGTRPR
jgi:RHS repeat-associated protein